MRKFKPRMAVYWHLHVENNQNIAANNKIQSIVLIHFVFFPFYFFVLTPSWDFSFYSSRIQGVLFSYFLSVMYNQKPPPDASVELIHDVQEPWLKLYSWKTPPPYCCPLCSLPFCPHQTPPIFQFCAKIMSIVSSLFFQLHPFPGIHEQIFELSWRISVCGMGCSSAESAGYWTIHLAVSALQEDRSSSLTFNTSRLI